MRRCPLLVEDALLGFQTSKLLRLPCMRTIRRYENLHLGPRSECRGICSLTMYSATSALERCTCTCSTYMYNALECYSMIILKVQGDASLPQRLRASLCQWRFL